MKWVESYGSYTARIGAFKAHVKKSLIRGEGYRAIAYFGNNEISSDLRYENIEEAKIVAVELVRQLAERVKADAERALEKLQEAKQ